MPKLYLWMQYLEFNSATPNRINSSKKYIGNQCKKGVQLFIKSLTEVISKNQIFI